MEAAQLAAAALQSIALVSTVLWAAEVGGFPGDSCDATAPVPPAVQNDASGA